MQLIRNNLLYFAFLVALLATLGSLYFSEILHLPPCVLCWYQRIFIYPLVVILAVGILLKDKKLYLYVLPLSITGTLIALYHNLLYYRILPESVAPCTIGVSCTAKLIEILGFITIPLLSLLAFITITIIMIIYRKQVKDD